MGSVSMYQCKKIVLILVGFSFSVSRLLLSLFHLIASPLFRFKSTGISPKNDFDGAEKLMEDSNSEPQSDAEEESNDIGDSVKGVEGKDEFPFTFKFPTYDEFTASKKEKGELSVSDFVCSPDTSRCEFTVGQSDRLFIKEPEVVDFVGNSGGPVSCEIKENEDIKLFDGNSIEVFSDGAKTGHSEPEDFTEETVEIEHNFLGNPVVPDHDEPEDFTEESLEIEHSEPEDFTEETVEIEHNFLGNNQESPHVPDHDEDPLGYRTEKDHNFVGNNQESRLFPDHDEDPLGHQTEKDHNFLGNNQESFLVPDHDEDPLGYQTEKDHNFLDNQESPAVSVHDEDQLGYQIDSHLDGGFLSEGDFMEESRHFDEEDSRNIDHGENSNSFKPVFLSVYDFHEDDDTTKIEDHVEDNKMENKKAAMDLPSSQNTNLKDTYSFDANKLDESLWEHEELIQLLHMELRKAKTNCLPTILEEESSESPKIVDDFKPWKSDDKFHHQECMEDLQKFYKSYTQRMRKLDIFNYQKMYAIGFLRLKDPLQTISSQKMTSGRMFKSMFPENLRQQFKHKVNERDPQEKFVKEMQSDLELVYVGQMCLSWELLRWQYGKALDLWDYDPPGIHRYNEVAGEFQRFQVLMQRFVEDEPFQEPRVQYYIKSRCVNRDLLQVPLIREDSSSSKNKRKGERSEYVITGDQLVEIIEESIRILLRFIRADKETCSLISKGHKGTPMQLQNLGDFELLKEIRNVLQTKEKKLKETRSGKFIFRKFGACREEDSDQVLYSFFSEVDMKLVRRVVNMSKITSDQLLWCHTKLSRICIEHRKLHVDSTFLPFPC